MKNMFLLLLALISNIIYADNGQFRIAGSATVYPFITLAVEQFAGKSSHNAAIVENIGTGGGIRLFCSNKINMAAASRKIKFDETNYCAKNNIEEKEIGEIIIGYDGIVIANSNSSHLVSLSSKDLFFALAKNIPYQGRIISNPYNKWNEVNPLLPNYNIEIYGPSHNSGTRDALIDLVIGKYCEGLEEMKIIYPNKDKRHKVCKEIREDGKFIEVGENYNLIIQKIKLNNKSFGIFGFNFYSNNIDIIQAALIDNISPSIQSISSKEYKLSRPLYLYYKKADLTNLALKAFIEELTSKDAISENGYLTKAGLVTGIDK
ncbi:MAG: substrate-binding domain-containing protein [Alphaproteobacteria bacterium]